MTGIDERDLTSPLTPECARGGSGQCDGFHATGGECGCPCHETAWASEEPAYWPTDAKVDDLKRWHDELHGLAARGYSVGLAALVQVAPDGTVTVTVDLGGIVDIDESNLDYTYPGELVAADESVILAALREGAVVVDSQ